MEFPVVTITLEGMRQTIQTAFTQYILEQDKYIQEALKDALMNFDIKKIVDDEIRTQFPRVIKDIIGDALRQAIWNNTNLRQRLTNQLAEGLAKEFILE